MTVICRCSEPTDRLRVEADFTDPIWCDKCNCNIDIDELNISDGLKRQLWDWVKAWGDTVLLCEDNIISSKERRERMRVNNRVGEALTERIKEGLEHQYEVWHMKTS